MKLSIFAATLILFFLTACGNADMGTPLEGEVECPFGLDGNGNCVKEGADPRPFGGTSKPGH
jgi:hypothetical protein